MREAKKKKIELARKYIVGARKFMHKQLTGEVY